MLFRSIRKVPLALQLHAASVQRYFSDETKKLSKNITACARLLVRQQCYCKALLGVRPTAEQLLLGVRPTAEQLLLLLCFFKVFFSGVRPTAKQLLLLGVRPTAEQLLLLLCFFF